MAVGGPLEPPLLPSPQAVVAHQPGDPAAADRQAVIAQFPRHARTAIGAVRQGKGRPDMRQQHHVVALAAAGRPTSPGEIAALADAEHAAQAVDGELRFRPIDEREPHRLPSRAKKAVAFFRMSRSWRRISFSRRSRFSSAVTSLSVGRGSISAPIPAPADPAHQRRKPNPKITGDLALRSPAGLHQPDRFLLKFLRKPSLLHHRVPHCSSGNSPLFRSKSTINLTYASFSNQLRWPKPQAGSYQARKRPPSWAALGGLIGEHRRSCSYVVSHDASPMVPQMGPALQAPAAVAHALLTTMKATNAELKISHASISFSAMVPPSHSTASSW